jgi:hypothetical protein
MQFASAGLGSVSLGSILQDPGTITDPTSLRPILTELNGVDVRGVPGEGRGVKMNTIKIQDTLGQPVTASFAMLNPLTSPKVGDRVRIFFHSQLIFAGTIDRVKKETY